MSLDRLGDEEQLWTFIQENILVDKKTGKLVPGKIKRVELMKAYCPLDKKTKSRYGFPDHHKFEDTMTKILTRFREEWELSDEEIPKSIKMGHVHAYTGFTLKVATSSSSPGVSRKIAKARADMETPASGPSSTTISYVDIPGMGKLEVRTTVEYRFIPSEEEDVAE